jgi:hypothetical protein
VLIRTVLDCRATSLKYIHQVLLLAASWHRCVADRRARPLELVVIGEPPGALRAFVHGLGVRILAASPDPNERIAKMSNTIVGGIVDVDDERVLLLDNDIVFLRDPELSEVADDTAAAAIAGQERVSPRQWEIVDEELHLAPLGRSWVSLRQEQAALVDGRATPHAIPRLYANGGVVLLPRGRDFALLWRRHVTLIAELFADRPERTPAVYGSVQAGLATAIGEWKRFVLLPVTYNFRPVCFVLGMALPGQVSLLHMSSAYDVAREVSTTERVRDYWDARIFAPLGHARARLDARDHEQRVAHGRACLDILTGLCREYELDAIVRSCLTST